MQEIYKKAAAGDAAATKQCDPVPAESASIKDCLKAAVTNCGKCVTVKGIDWTCIETCVQSANVTKACPQIASMLTCQNTLNNLCKKCVKTVGFYGIGKEVSNSCATKCYTDNKAAIDKDCNVPAKWNQAVQCIAETRKTCSECDNNYNDALGQQIGQQIANILGGFNMTDENNADDNSNSTLGNQIAQQIANILGGNFNTTDDNNGDAMDDNNNDDTDNFHIGHRRDAIGDQIVNQLKNVLGDKFDDNNNDNDNNDDNDEDDNNDNNDNNDDDEDDNNDDDLNEEEIACLLNCAKNSTVTTCQNLTDADLEFGITHPNAAQLIAPTLYGLIYQLQDASSVLGNLIPFGNSSLA